MIVAVLMLAIESFSSGGVSAAEIGENDGTWLEYHNGTAYWFCFEGAYRAVWFDLADFIPGAGAGLIEQTEFWFFHSSSYPWDSSDFFAEIWSGNLTGPETQLHQTLGTALHYAPMYITYNPLVEVPQTFWIVDNSQFSTGGWPSILADFQVEVNHSYFYSSSAWQEFTYGEYFIGVNLNPVSPLERTSWGSLKSVF